MVSLAILLGLLQGQASPPTQPYPPPAVVTVVVDTSDGGVPVILLSAPRLEVSASTEPGVPLEVTGVTGLPVRAEVSSPGVSYVEVTGLGGGSVEVSGTMGLTQEALNFLAEPTCVSTEFIHLELTTTPQVIPLVDAGTLLAGRTRLVYENLAASDQNALCATTLPDGGVPSFTYPSRGEILTPGRAGSRYFPENNFLVCLAESNAGTTIIQYMEERCETSP